jgi:outer membrane murein-binding lipoprotein Lpp
MKKLIFICFLLSSNLCSAEYYAITGIENNRISSYMNFNSLAEAQNFIASTSDKMPNSFVYHNLSNDHYGDLWIVNQTVTVVPLVSLSDYKKEKNQAIRAEAKIRAVALLGTDTDETETLFDVASMFNKLHKGQTLTDEETTLRAQLESLEVNRKAIRRAAKTAIQSVNAATTKAEVDAVTVSWP